MMARPSVWNRWGFWPAGLPTTSTIFWRACSAIWTWPENPCGFVDLKEVEQSLSDALSVFGRLAP